LFDLKVKKLQE